MNRYVLDASVIVKWLIPESPTEPDVEQVLALFAGLRDNTISVRRPLAGRSGGCRGAPQTRYNC